MKLLILQWIHKTKCWTQKVTLLKPTASHFMYYYFLQKIERLKRYKENKRRSLVFKYTMVTVPLHTLSDI